VLVDLISSVVLQSISLCSRLSVTGSWGSAGCCFKDIRALTRHSVDTLALITLEDPSHSMEGSITRVS
jgi:hypothetical protein